LLKRTQSILNELDNFGLHRDREYFLESKAINLIQGISNLLDFIKENYEPELAQELEKRLINSIKTGDSNKFVRGIRKIKNESKRNHSRGLVG
jgi:hypothetical protein